MDADARPNVTPTSRRRKPVTGAGIVSAMTRLRMVAPLLASVLAWTLSSSCSTDAKSAAADAQDPSGAAAVGTAEASASAPFEVTAGKPVPDLDGEVYFRNVRQLTFGGENAEAYFSFDGRHLILQSKRPPFLCDQIFTLDLTTGEEKLVSTGKGRTTCSYFLKGDDRIVYASTHLWKETCPPPVMRVGRKYVWPIYTGYDIFSANADGTDLVRLTDDEGYDAEATVDPVTGRIVFTSTRDGDLELYSMEPDGSNVVRLTNRPGYDGGAFYSHDGRRIVQRSQVFADDAALEEYQQFLAKGMVVPSHMEISVLDADGGNFRIITDNGKANFAPYWHPDNERILFSSNMNAPRGRNFEIYMMDDEGNNVVQLTHNETFDGFPMFSPDGRYLVFASNRYAQEEGNTNVFICEWVEPE